MATGSKRTKVSNLVVDISQGRQLRVMEDTLKIVLTPYIEKLSKDKNWYSPSIALVGVATALAKFDYKGIILTNDQNEYNGVNVPLIICLVVYVLLLIAALTLLCISLVNIYKCRKEDLSVHGIVEKIVSLHVEDDNNNPPNEQKQ